jgi:hypothetical protein
MSDTMAASESAAPVSGPPPTADWEHLFYPERNYEYFRQALTLAASSHIADARTAAWMADAAMLAYGRSGPELLTHERFSSFFSRAGLTCETIGEWSDTAHGTQAFFAYNGDFAVLSFRGTERNDWTDSLVDLTILPVRMNEDLPEPSTANKTMFHLGLTDPLLNPLDHKEIGVHAGFQLALNVVWPDVRSKLHNYRAANGEAPIFFTGHSLGAALATIAIARCEFRNLALFTFGSPRAGNKAFCEKVREQADGGIYRFVDNQDLVTTAPPQDLFYSHTAGMMHIDGKGDISATAGPERPGELRAIAKCLSVAAIAAKDYVKEASPPPELVDHSPSRYCYFTWRAVS